MLAPITSQMAISQDSYEYRSSCKRVPAKMKRVALQCVGVIRGGAQSVAQLAFCWTFESILAHVLIVRLAAITKLAQTWVANGKCEIGLPVDGTSHLTQSEPAKSTWSTASVARSLTDMLSIMSNVLKPASQFNS